MTTICSRCNGTGRIKGDSQYTPYTDAPLITQSIDGTKKCPKCEGKGYI